MVDSDRSDPVEVLAAQINALRVDLKDVGPDTGVTDADRVIARTMLAAVVVDGHQHTGWQLVYGTQLQGTGAGRQLVNVKVRWKP